MCQSRKSTASTAWRVPATLLPNWRARMPPRIGELNGLIELRLRADDNPLLVDLHLSDNELPGRDRYKIFPSFLLRELVQNPPSLDLDVVTSTVGDFRAAAFNSRNFVYVVFTTSQFVVIAVRGTVSLRDWGINLN